MAIFDIDNNIDNIDSNIRKHMMSQQIILVNEGRKSGTQLLFDPYTTNNEYNPYVLSSLEHYAYGGRQTFLPNSMEVVDYIINLFETTIPSEMNFVDKYWDPLLDPMDIVYYYIEDPFFDEILDDSRRRIVDLGCGLEYDSFCVEDLHIDLIQKLKNSEYISFDNGICSGSFTINFNSRQILPVLNIIWDEAFYIENDSSKFTIVGEVEVAIFYQILKIYKRVIDSI